MAVKNKLGFGMMRLPVHNDDPTDFDYEQINQVVDEFIRAGFTYFDTSYVYHNGKSEEATWKALVPGGTLCSPCTGRCDGAEHSFSSKEAPCLEYWQSGNQVIVGGIQYEQEISRILFSQRHDSSGG